jgi:hypothetical protein
MIRSIIICLLLMTVPVFAEHETNHYFIVDSTTAEFEGYGQTIRFCRAAFPMR